MILVLLTIATIAIAMLIMALGAIFAKRSLRGSCGGIQLRGPGGEPLNCDACPYRDENPDCEKRGLDSKREPSGAATQVTSGGETEEPVIAGRPPGVLKWRGALRSCFIGAAITHTQPG